MQKEAVILIAEDEIGHFHLIRKNLLRSGIDNEIVHFQDGQQVLDFFESGKAAQLSSCVLLLDIRLPKVSGIEVLGAIKSNSRLRKIPIIVLTTANTPGEILRCHELGCSVYIVKPLEYNEFIETIYRIGQFLQVIELPQAEYASV